MKRAFQRRGFATHSASTLSPAIDAAGISDRKLFSRICDDSNGRNGRKIDATAMLNMFPKLALIVVRMYFSVLANVMRPSSMPSRRIDEVRAQQNEVGGVLCHVDRVVHRYADVGGVQRWRIVDAVAHVTDDVSGLAQRKDDAFLLVRIDLGEDRGALGQVPQRFVAQLARFAHRSASLRPADSRLRPRGAPPCGCRR